VAGFVVDTESLIDVANSLATLRHVLNSIATDDVTPTEMGGLVLAQQMGGFNTQWRASVGVISGEVQGLQDALFTAATHYQRTEQLVSQQSHDTPTGSGPGHGGATRHAHDHRPHRTQQETHHHRHTPAHPRHDKGRHKDSGIGTTTIGGPRIPVTGTGTGTTVIGGAPEQHHKDHSKGTGTGTTTIGPGGVSTTVHTGPGRGYGTTTIGGNHDGAVALSAGSSTVHSDLLTSHQSSFVSALAALTGLRPRVVAAWCLSEESGANAAGCQARNDNNWLNIQTGADPSAWSDPVTAAQHTARFLHGEWGGASDSIQGIVGHAGASAHEQLSAISGSDWAADHFGHGSLLHETYGQLSGISISDQ
jgi:hypothetical protein